MTRSPEERLVSHYLTPGAPPPTPPAPQPNSYLKPPAKTQQRPRHTLRHHPRARARAIAGPTDPHRATLLAEWRTHHGSDWIRAGDLSTTILQE